MLKSGILILSAAATLTALPASAQPQMSAEDFVSAAAQSDLYEIDAARVVLTQSQNPQIRAFAQQMIDAHTKTSEALKQATMASGLPPPPMALSGDQRSLLGALQSLKGADLDHAYVTQQVNAHTSALVTEQAYAMSGSDANLRTVARSTTPIIQHHLEMAQQMMASMGSP